MFNIFKKKKNAELMEKIADLKYKEACNIIEAEYMSNMAENMSDKYMKAKYMCEANKYKGIARCCKELRMELEENLV